MLIALALMTLAADPEVVRTAPAGDGIVPVVNATAQALPQELTDTPHGLTTAQQIDRWIAAPSVDGAPSPHDILPEPERRVRGEVSAAIGTGGYREVGVRVEGPIGENGWGAISYQDRRF